MAQPLRTYLERYDGVHFADRSDPELPGRELVILLPFELMLDDCQEPQYQDYMDFFQYLIEAGHTLLLVGNSHNNIGITNGLLYLGAEREEDLKTLVSGLGNLDAVVNMSRLDNLHWIKSKHLISINLPSKELSETEIQKTLLGKIQSELAKSASPLEAKPENDPFWTKANHNLDHFLSRFKSFISKH